MKRFLGIFAASMVLASSWAFAQDNQEINCRFGSKGRVCTATLQNCPALRANAPATRCEQFVVRCDGHEVYAGEAGTDFGGGQINGNVFGGAVIWAIENSNPAFPVLFINFVGEPSAEGIEGTGQIYFSDEKSIIGSCHIGISF